MTYTIQNRFHNTEARITVKDEIKPIEGDIHTALCYIINQGQDGVHYVYAQEKLNEILSALCLHKGKGCCCCSGAIRIKT